MARPYLKALRFHWFAASAVVFALSTRSFASVPQERSPIPCVTKPHRWVGRVAPELSTMAPGIPLSFLLGWIQVESGGRIASTTHLDERGYFQLMPGESAQLGLDHKRLSNDDSYSLHGGILLVEMYAKRAEAQGYSRGDPIFWRIVKLEHAMGASAVTKLFSDMKESQADRRKWEDIERYSRINQQRLFKLLKHDPVKWEGNVDSVFATGSSLEIEWEQACKTAGIPGL